MQLSNFTWVAYLATDGFIDQNNPSRKKIGTLKLLSIFNEIQEEDMKKQKKLLISELEKHQQNSDQRDDITLLGIKI